VSTRILALDGEGQAEFFADYAQWETREKTRSKEDSSAASATQSARSGKAKKKLGYLQQREMDGMEEKIRGAEGRLEAARAALHDPKIASDFVALEKRGSEVEALTTEVVRLYARWAELEAQQG
jgi:ATP-binding cassette subfamily F protein uup